MGDRAEGGEGNSPSKKNGLFARRSINHLYLGEVEARVGMREMAQGE